MKASCFLFCRTAAYRGSPASTRASILSPHKGEVSGFCESILLSVLSYRAETRLLPREHPFSVLTKVRLAAFVERESIHLCCGSIGNDRDGGFKGHSSARPN